MILLSRSYYSLTMLNWIFSVLLLRNTTSKVGFLYDIGCNMEKGILKVSQVYFSLDLTFY